MYKYFVSYSVGSARFQDPGFGNATIKRFKKIDTIDEVVEMTRMIEVDRGFRPNTVVILNFILLGEEE